MRAHAKTEYVFDFGGENFSISRPAPSEDPDIWNVHDSNGQLFAEFDTDSASMATEELARTEVRMALIVDNKICCMCETRTHEGDDGLCIGCDLATFEERLGLDIYEEEDWDD